MRKWYILSWTAAEDLHSSSEDDSYQPTKVVIDEFINKSAVFLSKNALKPQGLVTIFIFFPSTLKTTREESKMSNFHTTLFQNSFVLVS